MVSKLLDEHHKSLVKIGTSNGGWIIPESALTPGAVAICVGAGEDISFDIGLNRKGMHVFTLDPTPRAAKHVRQVLDGARSKASVAINSSSVEYYDFNGFEPRRFKFLEIGLYNTNSVLQFWAPKIPSRVSYSVVNLQKTNEFFEAQCVRLQDLCVANDIDKIEILKLDIEGAEYAVLKDLAAGVIRPRVVCVEFDEGPNLGDHEASQRILHAVREIKQVGYRLLAIEHWNFLFSL